MKKITGIPAPK